MHHFPVLLFKISTLGIEPSNNDDEEEDVFFEGDDEDEEDEEDEEGSITYRYFYVCKIASSTDVVSSVPGIKAIIILDNSLTTLASLPIKSFLSSK